jgi:hypothetical protein
MFASTISQSESRAELWPGKAQIDANLGRYAISRVLMAIGKIPSGQM